MELLRTIGNESLPSVLNDPFKKTCVTDISVLYFQSAWSPYDWRACGTVRFKNGQTSGEQGFEGNTFDEVVMKIKLFLKEIDSK